MSRRTKAFTLIELIVVIAIIMVLVGLLAVSLRGMTASAGRTESLNAVRQLALAYNHYTLDNRGQLMPGYLKASELAQLQITAKLPDGTDLADPSYCDTEICAASSYVWRLAPYLDNALETIFTDMTDAGAVSQFHSEFDTGTYGPSGESMFVGGISERPSYGMNCIFVGGDSRHGGAYATDRNPWTPAPGLEGEILAATRLSQVKNPARLILFAPTAMAEPADQTQVYQDSAVGFCELRPPYLEDGMEFGSAMWTLPQWMVGAAGRIEKTAVGEYDDGAGLPIVRYGDVQIPVAHLDGSATVNSITELSRDMRRWNPFELALRRTTRPVAP